MAHIRKSKTKANEGVLNYSHLLDAPAGKHGFVKVKDGHFYFEDGRRAKFLGFNIAARSNTPDHELADRLAERFASLGVNMIRMHAADAPIGTKECSWSSSERTPLLDYQSGSTLEFCPEGLDRFDYFAAKLKEKGIYLHFDLLIARRFLEKDMLDYPGEFPQCVKCFPMFNQRLIELQKDYANKFLSHVNPYTGLAYKDDPAVAVVQINNEDSAIKGIDEVDYMPELLPYQKEVERKFNHFLLMKYDSRENLKKAWTFEEQCALGEDEDPAKGTVRMVRGSFYQPVNDPMGEWDGVVSPARYADYMEFGAWANRRFYRMFKDYLISLGVQVPIAASNLLGGAADVYGHLDGDFMENNSYFNHPILPVLEDGKFQVAGPAELVSANPLRMQEGVGAMGNTILSQASMSCVAGKPFMITEWNEYGLHPFHSTAFVQTIAYACLNDWDGLILYNHHTSEKDNQPDDEIRDVFDCYNDPAVICQWGFMAEMFLNGLVSPGEKKVEQVYTMNDLTTLPECHRMLNTILPYLTGLRAGFIESGTRYQGTADVAVNAGFLNGGDLSEAKHSVYYAWSPYRDALRRCPEKQRLQKAAAETTELEHEPGVHLGEKTMVIDDIAEIAGSGNYTKMALLLDQALKSWGILQEGTGLVDGKLISATGELVFDPDHAQFKIATPYLGYFSGAPEKEITLTQGVRIKSENERITLALIPAYPGAEEEKKKYDDCGGKMLCEQADEFVLTAMGKTGMDETEYAAGMEMMGIPLTCVSLQGKLYAETLKGEICVQAQEASLEALDTTGHVIGRIEGRKSEDGGIVFNLDGAQAAVQYRLVRN